MVNSISEKFDENKTRYRLVQTNSGDYNWLFFPGGPGADSQYFLPLIESLELPGKTWLIDLPGNGDNTASLPDSTAPYENWLKYTLESVKEFENPVFVGQSFGAMLALLLPELESKLKGLIILASAPIIGRGISEVESMLSLRNIKPNTEAIEEFLANQTDENFRKVLYYQSPAHFPEKSLAEGRNLFSSLPFNFKAMLWWFGNGQTYRAKWTPEKLPTLIIGGTEDCINPVELFLKDSNFSRENIRIQVLEGCGHFPWLEDLEAVKKAFHEYITQNL